MKYLDNFIDLLSDISVSEFSQELDRVAVDSRQFESSQIDVTVVSQVGAEGEVPRFVELQPTQATVVSSSPNRPPNASSALTLSIDDFARPYIVINDGDGASGSRNFAASFDAVAAIEDGNGRYCSGTLIANDLVLTARHCNVSPGDHVVFGDDLSNSTMSVSVESVLNPGGEGSWFDGNDVALLRLSETVPNSVAKPVRLTGETNSIVGQIGTIFGYGNNGVGSTGHQDSSDGFRWGGQNTVDFYGDFGGGENLFIADFDDGTTPANTLSGAFGSDANPIEYEAITTEGDSGSPLLARVNGQLVVAGVTSGGLDIDGKYGSVSFWTGVGRFAGAISNAGGTFVNSGGSSSSGGTTSGEGGGNGDGNGGVTLPGQDDHGNEVGGIATDLGFELNGSLLTAREDGFIGFGETPVEKDVFEFNTPITGRIIVDARRTSGNLDTVIRIYDAAGNLVEENDNAQTPATENPGDSQLILKNMPSGRYFVSVGASDGSNGGYRLAVRSGSGNSNSTEAGNSFASPIRILFDGHPTTFLRSSIENGVDQDYFEFTAVQSGRIVVRSKALNGNLNSVLRGYDEDRLLLDANNNYKGSLDSRVSFNVVQGRNYLLKLNSVGPTQGDYRLSLRMAEVSSNFGNSAPFSLRLEDTKPAQFASLDSVDQMIPAADFDRGLLAAV